MTSEESLSSGKDVSDNNSRSQGIEDVLIIRMKEKPIISVSWESDDCVDLKVFLHDLFKCNYLLFKVSYIFYLFQILEVDSLFHLFLVGLIFLYFRFLSILSIESIVFFKKIYV